MNFALKCSQKCPRPSARWTPFSNTLTYECCFVLNNEILEEERLLISKTVVPQ